MCNRIRRRVTSTCRQRSAGCATVSTVSLPAMTACSGRRPGDASVHERQDAPDTTMALTDGWIPVVAQAVSAVLLLVALWGRTRRGLLTSMAIGLAAGLTLAA